ncbi:unnamed protein product [Musa acuminata subsp. burmannicoides]
MKTGVEDVKTDCKSRTVVIKGKAADPAKICERIQKKTGKKVELISPPKNPEEEEEKRGGRSPTRRDERRAEADHGHSQGQNALREVCSSAAEAHQEDGRCGVGDDGLGQQSSDRHRIHRPSEIGGERAQEDEEAGFHRAGGGEEGGRGEKKDDNGDEEKMRGGGREEERGNEGRHQQVRVLAFFSGLCGVRLYASNLQ